MSTLLHNLHRRADPAGAAQADAADPPAARHAADAVRLYREVQAIQPATDAEITAAARSPEIGLHMHSIGDGFRSGVRWSERRVNQAAAPVYGDAVEALILAAQRAAESMEAGAKIIRPQFLGSAALMDGRREQLLAALAAVRKPVGVQ